MSVVGDHDVWNASAHETTPSGRTGDSTGERTWNGTGPYRVLGQSVVVFSAG